MQVLYALLRALSFCLSFFSGKLARIKSNFASLVKYKIQDVAQYCSFKKNSVRPELVEGLLVSSWWFDKLTTNG